MALVLLDRAKVVATSMSGNTSNYTLTNTPPTGFVDFTGVGDGNTTYYAAVDTAGNFEIGIGTFATSGEVLTRTDGNVIKSTNSNNRVSWPSNSTPTVFITQPADKAVFLDANGNLDSPALTGNPTAPTQSASDNSTKIATTAYTDTAISNLVDSSPSTLNTLNELAAALGDDANFSTTVTNSIATKMPLAGGTFTGSVVFEDAINENIFAITDASSVALDPDNGMVQTWTLGANRTATDSLTTGQSMLLIVTASSSNYTLTWPTMKWSGGSAPTLGGANATAIELFKVGSQLYGATVGDLS
jgi:hypothetical protein